MLRTLPWLALGVALVMVALFLPLGYADTEGVSGECDNELLTHNVKNSSSEARQAQYKLNRQCVLVSEVEMIMDNHIERYRQWCCPSVEASARSKRTVSLTPVSPEEEEEEPEQEDEPNQPVEAYASFLPWNLNRLDQRSLPLDTVYHPPPLVSLASQPTVHVYVIDSGIDAGNDVFAQVSVSMDYPSPSTATDCYGHGTKVASIIASYLVGVVSRGVDGAETMANVILHSVKVLGCDGTGSVQDLIKGLTYIQNFGFRPAFLSMSIGSAKSNTLNSALSAMTNSGDFVAIVAAGNDNVDACTTSPSSASNVVSVGATAENDQRSTYSNYGSCLAIFAPGDNIYSALIGTTNKISAESGTSFAQPHVMGLCVRKVLQNISLINNLHQAWIAVRDEATPNKVGNAGPGSPNLLAYSGKAASSPSSPPPPPPPPPPPTIPPPPPKSPPTVPPQQNPASNEASQRWSRVSFAVLISSLVGVLLL
jgi:hypothetical protein